MRKFTDRYCESNIDETSFTLKPPEGSYGGGAFVKNMSNFLTQGLYCCI